VYSARDEAVARQRGEILWLQRIQKALKEDRFELYLQPIVSVSGRVDTGPAYEVLLRMRGDDGTAISPVDFMQAAERYHLMPNVDRWVLQSSLSAIGSGTLKLPDQRSCNINLSGQTIGDPQFLDFVVDCLDRSGVPPAQICFEVRESSIVANLAHAGRFIAVLHGMGCEFAMDDFGSGLGAFSNLKSLAMDYLKIDGAIIRGLDEDEINQAMVAAMISLARTMDIRVVAEHVETDTVFEAVRRMGVDFAQGYAVGRPEPLKIQ
jgi:EAL domain-containing protein (putative c-di-GMP-specific phosphodiesterase class I)